MQNSRGGIELLTCLVLMITLSSPILATRIPGEIPLANDYVVLWESPNPDAVYGYAPGIARLDSGRLIATMQVGGAAGTTNRLRIYTSDDGGITWILRHQDAVNNGRPFQAGGRVYVLGQHGQKLVVTSSSDDGTTWTFASPISPGEHTWHAAPTNVIFANERVYLAYEVSPDNTLHYSTLAPVVLSASVHDNLQDPAAWTFSNIYSFQDALIDVYGRTQSRGLGVPFFSGANLTGTGRIAGSVGWLEANIVQFTDPDHVWHDPEGRTFYLWMRVNSGLSNIAAIAKATEDEAGGIRLSLAQAPSGQDMLFVSIPGGHLKFHIVYDESSKLFWLLANESIDSMRRPDRLPEDRYGLPFNERNRLVLYYSTNMIDWIRAGLVAVGLTPRESRHYASMAVDGDDLVIVSRSGDERAKSAHDGNLITFHRVRNFRDLVSWSIEYPSAKVIGARVSIVSPSHLARLTGQFVARMQILPSNTSLEKVVVELAGKTIYEGDSLPNELIIEPSIDGFASLSVTALTAEGDRLTDSVDLCFDTSWEIRDEFLPPLSTGYLGVIDRARTELSSSGWGYDTSSPDQFFGDAHRRVVTDEGDQYLIWRGKDLRHFSVILYATDESTLHNVSLSISQDGSTWSPVPYTISRAHRSSNHSGQWNRYELLASLPHSNAAFARVLVGSAVPGMELQIGEVLLLGGTPFACPLPSESSAD